MLPGAGVKTTVQHTPKTLMNTFEKCRQPRELLRYRDGVIGGGQVCCVQAKTDGL
jgi:hypothetical protein